MGLESSRELELEINVRHRDLLPEAVEQKDVDVVALQPDADRVVGFPGKSKKVLFLRTGQ